MNFTLQELKEASQDLEFLLESITKAEASLRAGGDEYKDFLLHIEGYKKDLTEPLKLLNKTLDDLETINGNINAAAMKNENNFRDTVAAFDDAILRFEERAKNLSSIIDLSEFEKQLSEGLKKTIGEIIASQKNHLETLSRIAKTLDDATKKFEATSSDVEKRLVVVEKKTGEMLEKLSEKIKNINIMTIGPWALASSLVATVVTAFISSMYYENKIDSLQKEASYYSQWTLPDEYYGSVGKTKYLTVKLNDDTRKVWRDGKTIYVELK